MTRKNDTITDKLNKLYQRKLELEAEKKKLEKLERKLTIKHRLQSTTFARTGDVKTKVALEKTGLEIAQIERELPTIKNDIKLVDKEIDKLDL